MFRAPLLVKLFMLARNASSFPAYYIHCVKTALEQGTSPCSVQRDVENNQNYCKTNVLKRHIGVRDNGNESLLVTCVVTWFSPADSSPLTLQREMSPHVLVTFCLISGHFFISLVFLFFWESRLAWPYIKVLNCKEFIFVAFQ